MAKKPEDGKQGEIAQLFDAVKRGATDEVQELLGKKLPVDSRDDLKRTPLILASDAGNVDLVKMLIDHGSDVNARDEDGDTPLMSATYNNHLEVVKLLVSSGADLDLRNNDGSTALEAAQNFQLHDLAAFLAAHSANSAARAVGDVSTESDDEGQTSSGSAVEDNFPPQDKESRGADEQMFTENTAPRNQFEPEDNDLIQEASSTGKTVLRGEATAETFGSEDMNAPVDGSREADSYDESGGTSAGTANWFEPELLPSSRTPNNNLPELSPREIALGVETMLHRSVEHGFHQVSRYLFFHVFKGDRQQAFSKKPNKGKRSLAEVARHLNGLVSRQWLADGVRAVAFEGEAEARGLDLSSFTFSHKIALAKLKDPEQMLNLAKEAVDKRYTVQQIKERVQEFNIGISSADKSLARTVMRQVGDLVRLTTDQETQAFLRNKERLAAALKKADRLKMLGHIEDAGSDIQNLLDLIRELEDTLVEITLSEKRSGKSGSAADSGPNAEVHGD